MKLKNIILPALSTAMVLFFISNPKIFLAGKAFLEFIWNATGRTPLGFVILAEVGFLTVLYILKLFFGFGDAPHVTAASNKRFDRWMIGSLIVTGLLIFGLLSKGLVIE